MAPAIGRGAFSAITIQSMADLGYSVDDGTADSFTFAGVGRPPAANADDPSRRRCVVFPPTDIEVVGETKPTAVRTSPFRLQVADPIKLRLKRR